MPGWYIHMEAARDAADSLRSGQLPADFPHLTNTSELQDIGELCHKWRNYLAIGALAPDLFYFMADFKLGISPWLMEITQAVLDTWGVFDPYIADYEKNLGPISANAEDFFNEITGGVYDELTDSASYLLGVLSNIKDTVIARAHDWFGVLTSGVPQGAEDSAFYWADMFHYRKTYEFPTTLLRDALAKRAAAAAGSDELLDAEAEVAFAVGWLTHCATDVTGHAFTNAKSGGPYRLHWQRHHLAELHMDAVAYRKRYGGQAYYEEFGKSALHFRISFATADGRSDRPLHDYFAGFPQSYPLGGSAADALGRKNWYDADPRELPDHLVEMLQDHMRTIYHPAAHDDRSGTAPRVLEDSGFSLPNPDGTPSGIPDADAMNQMWNIAYRYLRMVSSDGFSPPPPTPPDFFVVTNPPTPPGGIPTTADSAQGEDPSDSSNWFQDILDFLEFLVGCLVYAAQCILWFLGIIPGLIASGLTYEARKYFYEYVQVPLYSAFMATRRLLVESAFLMPRPTEIDPGMITLGHSSAIAGKSLWDDLTDATGFAPVTDKPFDEPSGRQPGNAHGADRAYPRAIVKDDIGTLQGLFAFLGAGAIPPFAAMPDHDRPNSAPSAYVRPWEYPEKNIAGQRNGWEARLSHPGPWLQGMSASELLDDLPGNAAARKEFEEAKDPQATSDVCDHHIGNDEHLGGPVNYSLYLIDSALAVANGTPGPDGKPAVMPPDMNLDSDRGYAWHTWDYDRSEQLVNPRFDSMFGSNTAAENWRYVFKEPCTVPQAFGSNTPDNGAWCDVSTGQPPTAANAQNGSPTGDMYDPEKVLAVHYRETGQAKSCGDLDVRVPLVDIKNAGMRPNGARQ